MGCNKKPGNFLTRAALQASWETPAAATRPKPWQAPISTVGGVGDGAETAQLCLQMLWQFCVVHVGLLHSMHGWAYVAAAAARSSSIAVLVRQIKEVFMARQFEDEPAGRTHTGSDGSGAYILLLLCLCPAVYTFQLS